MLWILIGEIVSFASAHPLNISALTTTSLPEGATNHGNAKLVCMPASWFTVASFILGNYVAHAATTQVFPGEKLPEQILATVTSLLYPGAGVVRGLNSIVRGILSLCYCNMELQQAAAAGALCMVVRTKDWTPFGQYPIHGVQLNLPVSVSQLLSDVT